MLQIESRPFYMVCVYTRNCQIDCSDINYMGGANHN